MGVYSYKCWKWRPRHFIKEMDGFILNIEYGLWQKLGFLWVQGKRQRFCVRFTAVLLPTCNLIILLNSSRYNSDSSMQFIAFHSDRRHEHESNIMNASFFNQSFRTQFISISWFSEKAPLGKWSNHSIQRGQIPDSYNVFNATDVRGLPCFITEHIIFFYFSLVQY